ncbi:MAG: phosphoribosylglycinamide formyltransferase [Oscillospiraceae bacterium]|nr:phosphoribosylglycinamide formyltransferase [Oscillospiraceae bacterium]
MNIAVLVSGGGTNLQALIDAQSRGELSPGRITLVISSKPDAYALERAAAANIKTMVLRPRDFTDNCAFDQAMLCNLTSRGIGLVALGGYLSMLGRGIIKQYERKILNVHPSLLPSFGGKGFYGLRVHRAVLESGVKVSGATVHFVNEIYDGGEIILQKAVDVLPGDTPEILQRRVMQEAEQVIFPKAVGMVCRGEV